MSLRQYLWKPCCAVSSSHAMGWAATSRPSLGHPFYPALPLRCTRRKESNDSDRLFYAWNLIGSGKDTWGCDCSLKTSHLSKGCSKHPFVLHQARLRHPPIRRVCFLHKQIDQNPLGYKCAFLLCALARFPIDRNSLLSLVRL